LLLLTDASYQLGHGHRAISLVKVAGGALAPPRHGSKTNEDRGQAIQGHVTLKGAPGE